MIFADWNLVLDGDKVETRRVCPPGAKASLIPNTASVKAIFVNGRQQYQVGQVRGIRSKSNGKVLYWRHAFNAKGYEIWSEAGKSTPPDYLNFKRAEYEITDLWFEQLGDMSHRDYLAEGYPPDCGLSPKTWFKRLWESDHETWTKGELVIVIKMRVKGGIRNGYQRVVKAV